jgi:hypothetical protein
MRVIASFLILLTGAADALAQCVQCAGNGGCPTCAPSAFHAPATFMVPRTRKVTEFQTQTQTRMVPTQKVVTEMQQVPVQRVVTEMQERPVQRTVTEMVEKEVQVQVPVTREVTEMVQVAAAPVPFRTAPTPFQSSCHDSFRSSRSFSDFDRDVSFRARERSFDGGFRGRERLTYERDDGRSRKGLLRGGLLGGRGGGYR